MSLAEKDCWINIRCSKQEREQLKELARKRGLNSSEMVRQWIKKNKVSS